MSKIIGKLLKYFFTNPLYVIILISGFICTIFGKKIIGWFGEYWTRQRLKKLPKNKYNVINNILIKVNDRTHQIDHIVVSKYGIFSIETKQYNGFITGNKYDKKWIRHVGKKVLLYESNKTKLWSC